MKFFTLSKLAVVASFVFGLSAMVAVAPSPGYANGSDDPCEGLRGRKKRKCESENNRADRELYLAGYELVEEGKYKEALATFHKIKNQEMPAVWNYIGFSTRKLGDVDGALVYYKKALQLAPDLTLARAYMGQAYLQKNEPSKADEQLAEISTRCGKHCAEYALLEKSIGEYKTKHS